MDDRIKGLLFGSFIGDAVTLVAHWIYNPSKIKRLYGRVTDYLPPNSDSYHTAKTKGDFTHYGDQTLVLLESISERKPFDIEHVVDRWRNLFVGYKGYIDKASKETLKRFGSGIPLERVGSSSNDLSGAARIAPLFLTYGEDQFEALRKGARRQTAMTHNDSDVVEASVFFTHILTSVFAGRAEAEAIKAAAEQTYQRLPAKKWVQRAADRLDEDPVIAIVKLGQTSHAPDAFPSSLHL